MKDKDRRILQKIIAYIDDIAQYASGFHGDSFLQDKKTMSACAFGILQIGELAKELSDDIQNQNPTIPWNGIKGLPMTTRISILRCFGTRLKRVCRN